MTIWALMMSLMIPAAYFVGKNLWDKTTGFLVASLFVFDYQLIVGSRQVSQPLLLPLFSLIILYIFSLPGKMTIKRLSWLVFSLFLPLHFHYAILIIFPAVLFWGTRYWLQLVKKENNLLRIYLPFLVGLIMLFFWVFLTYRIKPFDQLFFFLYGTRSERSSLLLSQIIEAVIELVKMTWGWKYVAFTMALSVTFVLVAGWWPKFSQQSKEKYLIIVSFLSGLLLCGLYTGDLVSNYLLGLVPFYLMLMALGLRVFLKKNKLLGITLYLIVLTIFIETTHTLLFWDTPKYSFFNQQRDIAVKIYEDYQNNTLNQEEESPALTIAFFGTDKGLPFDGWGVNGFWFFLEELFDQRLVRLTNFGVNTSPIVQHPRFIYFICEDRVEISSKQQECLDRFTSVRNYLKPGHLQVFQNQYLAVWRFEIDSERPFQGYNHVYQDLLK